MVDPELSQSVVILMVPVVERVMEARLNVVGELAGKLAELTVADGDIHPS